MMEETDRTRTAGWREWLALPDLNIDSLEAKIDTGIDTSVLQPSFFEHFQKDGCLWVRFGVNPDPDREDVRLTCLSPVKRTCDISLPGGHEKTVFVIETSARIGGMQTTLELSLANLGISEFTVHLGRDALQALELLVDPHKTHVFGKA